MADNTERLVVEVDVGSLGKGADALEDFAKKADDAGVASEGTSGKVKTLADVFGKVADPIDDTGKAVDGLSKNYKNLTISQGQYTAAMRMMPAQLTDVVTQLAGGQNPFLILIQQGGQVKDSLGGLSNTFKILKAAITPASLAMLAAGSAITAMGAAAYLTGKQFDEVATSVIFMGGAGFKSMEQLNTAAADVAAKTGASLSSVVDTMVDLNNKGGMTAKQMEVVAAAMTEMDKAGRDSNESMAEFAKLTKDPIKGMAELNEKYGFLTEAQAKYVIQLKKTKGEEEATNEVINLFAKSMTERSKAVVEATDNIGQFWSGLKTTASNVFNDMGVTIRAWGNQIIDIFKLVETSISAFFNTISDLDSKFTGAIINSVRQIAEAVPGGQKLVDMTGLDDWDKQVKERGENARKELAEQTKQYNLLLAKITDPNAQAKYEAEARSNSNVKATGTDQKSRDAVSDLVKQSEKKAKADKVSVDAGDRLVEQYQQQSLALQAQIQVLQTRSAFQTEQSQQMKDYQLLQAKINILEGIAADTKGRALTKQEQQLLAQKNEVLTAAKNVAEQGEVVKQLTKQAQISDELQRSHNNILSQVEGISASWGKSNTEAERLIELQTRAAALRDKGATEEQISVDADDMTKLWEAQDAKREDWVGGLKTGMEEFAKSATDYASIAQNAVSSAFGGMADAMTDFLTTGSADMKAFTVDMLKMIVQIINKWLILKAIQGIGSAIGGSFGNFTAGLTANALGGAYSGGNLSAFSGQVVTQPTLFNYGVKAFANGAGLMGEAGPEAILPLQRDSSGALGVKASVSGAGGGTSIGGISVTVVDGKASASSTDSGAVGRAYAAVIADSVNSGIERAIKPGGLIFMANNSRG